MKMLSFNQRTEKRWIIFFKQNFITKYEKGGIIWWLP